MVKCLKACLFLGKSMTREEFSAALLNYQKLNLNSHVFVTVHDPSVKILTPSSIIDWGVFVNHKQASFLVEEFLLIHKKNFPAIIDKNGVKTKTTIGKICDFAKKSTASIKIGRVGKGKVNNPSEKTVWVQNQRHEPQLKGLILLGTAYDYFVRDFFDCRYNPQNKANVIETLLRLYGPSSSNKVDITSFDSWYIHVFERDRVGRFNRSRFNFTDKLFELYETTDQDKMVILNHWI